MVLLQRSAKTTCLAPISVRSLTTCANTPEPCGMLSQTKQMPWMRLFATSKAQQEAEQALTRASDTAADVRNQVKQGLVHSCAKAWVKNLKLPKPIHGLCGSIPEGWWRYSSGFEREHLHIAASPTRDCASWNGNGIHEAVENEGRGCKSKRQQDHAA